MDPLFNTYLCTGVIAVPLGISYDKVADLDATESANKGRLDAGTTLGMSYSPLFKSESLSMSISAHSSDHDERGS